MLRGGEWLLMPLPKTDRFASLHARHTSVAAMLVMGCGDEAALFQSVAVHSYQRETLVVHIPCLKACQTVIGGLQCCLCRHVRDVLWWLEHVCGVNMLDHEEKVVVICIFLAVLVLIILGAYKQSTVLLHLFKQLMFAGPTH